MSIPKTYHLRLENDTTVFKIRQDNDDGSWKLIDAEGSVPQDIVDYLNQRYSDTMTHLMEQLEEDDESKLVLKTGTISFNSTGAPTVSDGLRGIVRFYHDGALRKYSLQENIPKYELTQ